MSIESIKGDQEQPPVKQAYSREEIRNRAKGVLEKANQLLKDTGKPSGSETPSQGDRTQ